MRVTGNVKGCLLGALSMVAAFVLVAILAYAVFHRAVKNPEIEDLDQLVLACQRLVLNPEQYNRSDSGIISRSDYPPEIQRLDPSQVWVNQDDVTILLRRSWPRWYGYVVFADKDEALQKSNESAMDLIPTDHPVIYKYFVDDAQVD